MNARRSHALHPVDAVPLAAATGLDRISALAFLGAVFCVTAAIHEVGWAEGTGFLIVDGIAAALVGLYLAGSSLPGSLAAPAGLLIGLELILAAVGNLWPPVAYVLVDLRAFGPWLDRARWGQWGGPAPFAQTSAYIERQWSAVTGRTFIWIERASSGASNADRRVWLLLVSTAVFVLVFFAAWQLFRRWRPALAVLPLGVALGVNSSLAGQRPSWALAFLGLAIVALVRGTAKGLERRWRLRGTDYSEELLPYATFFGIGLAAAVILLSPIVPAVTSRSTYEAFWRLLSGPWRKVEETTGRLFGGLDSPLRRESQLKGDTATPDLPAEHSIGGGLPLGNGVVFYVKTDDPAPEPWAGEIRKLASETIRQRHWRAATYDTYTGVGWENRDRQESEMAARAPLPGVQAEGRREFRQQFRLMRGQGGFYAAGQPLTVDESTTVTERDDQDLISLKVRASTYEVVSLVPDLTVADLEAVGIEYPDWVRERYLALPPVPQRVGDLVAQVTEGAQTPYQKARAIEGYLRQFPYDLEVRSAPAGRDVVDYFLFDLQRGYCDYFASAMTVMLRAAGVPARLALGYARGEYNRALGEWVVSERDSHAWVEIYFPTYGWIEFEPTPSQDVYSFPAGGAAEFQPPLRSLPTARPALRWPFSSFQTAAGAGGLGLLALIVVLLVRSVRRLRYKPEQWVAESYGRALQATSWVGLRPGETETVREFWQRLRSAMADEAVFVSTPWGSEWVWQFDRVAGPLRYVLAAYEQALFGPAQLGQAVGRRARQSAARLRRELGLLWLSRRVGE